MILLVIVCLVFVSELVVSAVGVEHIFRNTVPSLIGFLCTAE